MGRPIRIEYEQAVYHVMARGNARQEIYGDDGDRQMFLGTLSEMVTQHKLPVHAYCLMSNHYHLLIETPLGNLSRGIGWLQNTYTIRYNRRYRRVGHLFQGRFKAQLVEVEGYARQLIPYIHLNPARVGIKKGSALPKESWEELKRYRWSSHRVYGGWEKAPVWLSEEWRKYFGRKESEQRREYRKVIRGAFQEGVESPWEGVRRGLLLGSEAFIEQAEELMERKGKEEEVKWLANEELVRRRQRVRTLLKQEPDFKVQIWLRVRMGQERMIDLGRELGYRNGSGVSMLLKRFERELAANSRMRRKLLSYEKQVQS